MRKNEFKLRQKELSSKPIPVQYREEAKRMLNQNVSKKAICMIFGCNYEHLKALR